LFSTGTDHNILPFLKFEFFSTDAITIIGPSSYQLYLQGTEEREINCRQYVDSRPPPSSFTWDKNGKAKIGPDTYLLKSEAYSPDEETLICIAHDWFSKYLSYQ